MIKEISWEIYLDPDIGVSGLSAGLCAMSQQIFEPRTVLDNLESVITVRPVKWLILTARTVIASLHMRCVGSFC